MEAVCLKCGSRDDLKGDGGLCSVCDGDDWLEEVDVRERNGQFVHAMEVTGFSIHYLENRFYENGDIEIK